MAERRLRGSAVSGIGMVDYLRLSHRCREGHFNFIVESPRGSNVKFKYDVERDAFVFQRALLVGVAYPFDWGFVAGTRAPDGDPLDAMVIHDATTWPGVVIPARAVGILCVTQKGSSGQRVRNDRVILVPESAERCAEVANVPQRLRSELERFFKIASKPEKEIGIIGWEDGAFAEKVIDDAAREHIANPISARATP
jgi:inorganic pyrophosphatase